MKVAWVECRIIEAAKSEESFELMQNRSKAWRWAKTDASRFTVRYMIFFLASS